MPKIKSSYIIASAILIGFFFLTSGILVFVATTPYAILAFGVPMIVGILSSLGFYYIFTHEETFPFAVEIEKQQKKAEKQWLRLLPRSGKAVTVIMLGIVGGPLLAAFSAQFLIPDSEYKYQILAFTGGLSGFLIAGLTRGIFGTFLTL